MLNTRSVLWQRTIIFVFIALVSRNCLCAGMLAAATPVSPLPTRGAPPVNQAPAIDPVSDQILFENAGVQTVALTGIGPGNGPADAGQTVTISAASSNTTLIPASALTVTLSGATGILTYQTKADTAGSAIITLTVTDNGGTANGGVDTTITTFTVTIEPPPTLAAIANQSCYQGGGIQTVSLTGIGTGAGPEAANYFVTTLTASSDNPSLVPAPTITGTGAAGTLQYQPASTASGQAHITVTVADSFASGGVNISVRNTRSLPATIAITGTTTFSRTFTITVNGPPTTPQVVGPSAGALVSPLVPFALLATDPGGNALRYDIQVASSTDGPWTDLFTSTATYASSSATAAEFLVPTAGKLAAQSYFWRASAINIAGMAGVWSTPQSMTITPATLPLATAAGTVLLSIPAMTGFMPQMGKWVNQGSIALATATWNASTQNYTITNVSPTLSSLLQPISTTTSTGFWVKANSPLSLAFAGFPQTAPAVQHLLPGWNLIGMPYLQPIAWDMSALQVRQGETVKSLTDAVQANWVKGFAWGWQPDAASPSGGSYVLIYDNTVIPGATGILVPWQGYWMKAIVECDLLLPAPVTLAAMVARRPSRLPAQGWFVRLLAHSTSGTSEATLGEHPLGASLSVNRPPMQPGDGTATTRLSFLRDGQSLALDILPPQTIAASWNLTVSLPRTVARGGEAVALTWPDIAALPKSLSLVLVDNATGTRCYLRTNSQYVFTARPGEAERQFTLQADNNRQSLLQVYGMHSEQTRAHGARMAFTLSKPAQTTLTVCTLTGRVVARLETTASRTSGAQTAVWNGNDAQGHTVPGGMYLFQVQAIDDEQRQVRAVTMVPIN